MRVQGYISDLDRMMLQDASSVESERDLKKRLKQLRRTIDKLEREKKKLDYELTSFMAGANSDYRRYLWFEVEAAFKWAIELRRLEIDTETLSSAQQAKSSKAPRLGERLLLLVLRSKEERNNIPGDLEEEYREIAARHGVRYAKLWYYKQVVSSALPAIRKIVRWGLMVSAWAWIRRLI
jgi:hypothetical protein